MFDVTLVNDDDSCLSKLESKSISNGVSRKKT